MVTICKSIHDTDAPFYRPVEQILARIQKGSNSDLINIIRKTKDKSEKQELKKRLPAICFSGIFNKRKDASIQEHSGLICLDFDGYDTPKKAQQDKLKISKDKYVYSAFISPSGLGIKVLVKIPKDADTHKDYFNSLKNHFNSPHFDISCKNVSRVCYESFDPQIYVNEEADTWLKLDAKEYQEVTHNDLVHSIPITDEHKIVSILKKWWEKKYPMVEGQRNHNCYVLACAFNDFGVSKSLAEYILYSYSTEDFSQSEIKQTIDSAYANVQNFKTRFYADEEKMTRLKNKVQNGDSKDNIKNYLADINIPETKMEGLIETAEKEAGNIMFWSKSEKGKITIVPFLYKKFLEENGFYKFAPEGTKNYVFVKVTNNLVDHTSENEIKDFVLEYFLDKELIEVYNFFASIPKFFKEDFLTLLSSIDIMFVDDTKYDSYLYYRNCAVKISKDKKEVIDYIDLGGYVWKDHVIDRDFNFCEGYDCDYKTFIYNICNGDEGRIKSMESTIGYMLHGYKNLSFAPAVILNDEVISDSPEGGTGKGIFINALSHMKKLVVIDGKSFDFASSFPYQTVSSDTQILCFDDVRKNFNFERLFSIITEGLTLEKKNKDALKIPFEKSPKISITTNYAITGTGNSFERRKWELELMQYYTKDFTPLHEFGRLMFGDWDEDEWCKFDNYMLSNLQMYLKHGLIKSSFVNLKIRKLSAETCHEFIEWCGLLEGSQENPLLKVDKKIMLNEIYFNFIDEYPDFAPKAKMTISRTRFYKWVNSYAIFKEGVPPIAGKDMHGKWIRIIKQSEMDKQLEL